jgi:DNA-binding MarR family transcriptional regulator
VGATRQAAGSRSARATSAPAPGTSSPAASAPAAADVAAWRALVASHAVVSCALDRELGERHGLGVSDFEVLERLTESEDHRFRVQELANAVHLSQSALSRLIGRLEQHGLVERCLCDQDRRGIYVTLTDEGRRRHAAAVPTHRAVLAATLPPAR